MLLPLDRRRLSAKNLSDDAEDIEDASLRSPAERLAMALSLSEVAEDLRAHGAGSAVNEDEPRRIPCLCHILQRR
jgi:hypothetical protein